MTDNDPDTTTPLDGDGHNVVSPTDPAPVTAGFPNVSKSEYETRGQTVVATRRGYAFASNDTDIPVITHDGVKVTKEQADALVDESSGEVYIRNNESEEG